MTSRVASDRGDPRSRNTLPVERVILIFGIAHQYAPKYAPGAGDVNSSALARAGGLERNGRNVYPCVCTWCIVKTAKVFKSGNSQAVRIPREFQLDDDEVEIRRRGKTLVLEPRKRSWSALFESLDKFTDDFMVEGRKQPALQKRRRTL
jgi:antitoxin VapB